jgi:hypothetical protein
MSCFTHSQYNLTLQYLNHNISSVDKWARKRNWKNRKKALKTTYQDNPEVFETEPSELHSDADREEDTMV